MSKLPKFNELNTCHFITTKVWQDRWLFKEDKYCQIVADNLNFYRKKFGFKLIAYAILPWHLHLILMLSRRFNDISRIMRDFKKFTAIQIVQQLIRDKKERFLQWFSLTGKIEIYPPTLGLKARSEDLAIPAKDANRFLPMGEPRSLDRGNNSRAGSEDPAVPDGRAELRYMMVARQFSGWDKTTASFDDPAVPVKDKFLTPTGMPRSSDRGAKKPARSKDPTIPVKKRKYQIWLPDNYDFNVYFYEKLEQKVDYVNNNAVKHGLVADPVDYKYSSAKNYYLNNHSIIKIDQIS